MRARRREDGALQNKMRLCAHLFAAPLPARVSHPVNRSPDQVYQEQGLSSPAHWWAAASLPRGC